MRKNAAIVMLFTLVMLLIPAVPPVDAAAPVLTTTGGSTAFVAGDNILSTPVAIDSGLTLSDPDSATLTSATVEITANLRSGEDILHFENNSFALYGDISAAYNATRGSLTLTSSSSSATVGQWQAALRAITYTNTAITPNTATRTISFTVDDGSGLSNTATKLVTVQAVDQTPIVEVISGTVYTTKGNPSLTINDTFTVSDRDNSTQSSARVSIESGFQSGDVLTFVNTNSTTFGNIFGSFDLGTYILTLTSPGATASNAQWSRALSAVTFASSSSVVGPRTIRFSVNDGTKSSAAVTTTVILGTVPGAPTGVTAVAGDGEATISFTPPASDGGSAITDYTVTSSPDGLTATGTSSPIKVTGLTNGKAYTFTVTATNHFGNGPASAASNSVTSAASAIVPVAVNPSGLDVTV